VTIRAMYVACALAMVALLFAPASALGDEGEWGDAPEDGIAYPWIPVTGTFPTCFTGSAGFVYHGPLCWAHFPGSGAPQPPFDFEADGNVRTSATRTAMRACCSRRPIPLTT